MASLLQQEAAGRDAEYKLERVIGRGAFGEVSLITASLWAAGIRTVACFAQAFATRTCGSTAGAPGRAQGDG